MKYDRIRSISDRLDAGKITIDELAEYKILFNEFAQFVTESDKKTIKPYEDIIKKFLCMCNDYYIFSNSGDVLITDRTFDMVTNVYKELSGESQIIYTTHNPSKKTWNERKHIAPNMIGSIEKVYTFEDAYDFVESFAYKEFGRYDLNSASIAVTPKFDGASVVLTYKMPECKLVAALTRKDGVFGQDITELIEHADTKNVIDCVTVHGSIADAGYVDVKCEILVSTENFTKLCEVKQYKNRRAAASAISANPSNIHLAKFLTIKPLVVYRREEGSSVGIKSIALTTDADIMSFPIKYERFIDTVSEYLAKVRDPEFGFRVDGVVLTVMSRNKQPSSLERDIMSDSIAYKCNTQVGITRVIDGYLSIGRTGKATPMIHVEPCDVNETTVTDISLSNFKKVNKYNLCKGDVIEVESAGDVIPMIKDVVTRHPSGRRIQYEDRCPHCGHRLKVVNGYDQIKGETKNTFDLYCVNPTCTRVIAGKLANFLDKMGAKNISDGVLTSVVELTGIRTVPELFSIKAIDLSTHDGWGDTSATDFVEEITRIKESPTPCSRFLGSLGIPNVSIKKCKKLMTELTLDDMLKGVLMSSSKDKNRFIDKIMDIDGFSSATANNIYEFLSDNYDDIKDTMKILNLVQDDRSNAVKGNVVMTGFRDDSLMDRIEELGFENSDNVNRNTVAVIAASLSTGKARKAQEKGIPIYKSYDADRLLEALRKL